MSNDISLNLETLKDGVIASNNEQLNEINTAMNDLCNTIASLTAGGWEGKSKDSCLETFSRFKNSMRIFYENLKSFNEVLESIHVEGEQLADEGNQLITNL